MQMQNGAIFLARFNRASDDVASDLTVLDDESTAVTVRVPGDQNSVALSREYLGTNGPVVGPRAVEFDGLGADAADNNARSHTQRSSEDTCHADLEFDLCLQREILRLCLLDALAQARQQESYPHLLARSIGKTLRRTCRLT
jgi:hypothetical protein